MNESVDTKSCMQPGHGDLRMLECYVFFFSYKRIIKTCADQIVIKGYLK